MRDKHDLNKYRHKWENRMVAVAIVVAILATAAVIVFVTQDGDPPGWLTAIVIGAYVSPLIIATVIHWNYWKFAVDAVEVTDDQYPELYEIFKEQVERGGFDYMPRFYVMNGNGTLNAFASKNRLNVKKGGYVFIFSDMVDAFYDLGNADTVRFVISHELGHLKLGHVNVRRNVMQGVLRPLFLHDTFSRAQEYSADRFGASITDGIAMPSLAILAAGKRNYERVDIDAYIDNDSKHISKLWVAIVNFRADHAVGRRRLAAAREMDQEGWEDVHGRML